MWVNNQIILNLFPVLLLVTANVKRYLPSEVNCVQNFKNNKKKTTTEKDEKQKKNKNQNKQQQ